MDDLDATDWQVRFEVYSALADTGSLPRRDHLIEVAGGAAALGRRLRRLHDRHQLVLDDDGEIRMALPFSAIPTDHVVRAGDRRWFANCAWDALAIPAALGVDARIDATWIDDGTPVELEVRSGSLHGDVDARVHFTVPAAQWWDDIVHT